MDFNDLSDDERLVVGLRLRLKHVRLAMAEVDAGDTPEGFNFFPTDTPDSMLAQLRQIETEVEQMLRDHGADDARLT